MQSGVLRRCLALLRVMVLCCRLPLFYCNSDGDRLNLYCTQCCALPSTSSSTPTTPAPLLSQTTLPLNPRLSQHPLFPICLLQAERTLDCPAGEGFVEGLIQANAFEAASEDADLSYVALQDDPAQEVRGGGMGGRGRGREGRGIGRAVGE